MGQPFLLSLVRAKTKAKANLKAKVKRKVKTKANSKAKVKERVSGIGKGESESGVRAKGTDCLSHSFIGNKRDASVCVSVVS